MKLVAPLWIPCRLRGWEGPIGILATLTFSTLSPGKA